MSDPMFRGFSAYAYRALAESSIRRLLRHHTAEAREHARKWVRDLRQMRALGL